MARDATLCRMTLKPVTARSERPLRATADAFCPRGPHRIIGDCFADARSDMITVTRSENEESDPNE